MCSNYKQKPRNSGWNLFKIKIKALQQKVKFVESQQLKHQSNA